MSDITTPRRLLLPGSVRTGRLPARPWAGLLGAGLLGGACLLGAASPAAADSETAAAVPAAPVAAAPSASASATSSPAAHALTITVTSSGPDPATATVPPGTTVVFHNGDVLLGHSVASSTRDWSFASGTIAPGGDYTVPAALRATGTYGYSTSGGGAGTVRVAAGAAAPSPSAARSAAPAASGTAMPSASTSPGGPVSASATPSASGSPSFLGSGAVVGPHLSGFEADVVTASPSGTPADVAPQVAPTLPASPSSTAPLAADTAPLAVQAAPSAAPAAGAVREGRDTLPEPASRRHFGLPVALAVVALVGAASLLLRLLLAESRRLGVVPGSDD